MGAGASSGSVPGAYLSSSLPLPCFPTMYLNTTTVDAPTGHAAPNLWKRQLRGRFQESVDFAKPQCSFRLSVGSYYVFASSTIPAPLLAVKNLVAPTHDHVLSLDLENSPMSVLRLLTRTSFSFVHANPNRRAGHWCFFYKVPLFGHTRAGEGILKSFAHHTIQIFRKDVPVQINSFSLLQARCQL